MDPNQQQVISLVCKRDYFGTIKQVVCNELWTAVLAEGKVSLHLIEEEEGQDIFFPANQGEPAISEIALADNFLLMIDENGKLIYFLIEDAAIILEHSGQNPIKKVFPNRNGTKCVCIDDTGNGYLFNPVDETSILIPNFQAETKSVLWDLGDQNLFASVDTEKMQTYLYTPLSMEGPTIIHLPEYLKLDEVDKQKPGVVTIIDRDMTPVILKDGYVYSNTRTDGIRGQYLTTHSYMSSWRGANDSDEGNLRYFLQNLACHKYEEALEVARISQKFS